MIAFTRFGVSFGLACIISATAPATTGDAMLVPVRLRYGLPASRRDPLTRFSVFVRYSRLPGADSETMPVPVATRSGLAPKSIAVGPRELYGAILLSVRFS